MKKITSMWNEKFTQVVINKEFYTEENYMYGIKPNVFLQKQIDSFESKQKILFLGEGEGRNACYAAALGHDVTALDASDVGLAKANELAKHMNVQINTILLDLEDFLPDEMEYDYILTSYLHLEEPLRSKAFKGVLKALKPFGMLMGEFFTEKQISRNSGGPKKLELLYTSDSIAKIFDSEDIIMNDEVVVDLDEGKHHVGKADVLRLIVQKVN